MLEPGRDFTRLLRAGERLSHAAIQRESLPTATRTEETNIDLQDLQADCRSDQHGDFTKQIIGVHSKSPISWKTVNLRECPG